MMPLPPGLAAALRGPDPLDTAEPVRLCALIGMEAQRLAEIAGQRSAAAEDPREQAFFAQLAADLSALADRQTTTLERMTR